MILVKLDILEQVVRVELVDFQDSRERLALVELVDLVVSVDSVGKVDFPVRVDFRG